MHHRLFESQYSRTSLNRTLLFQKVFRFSRILVYTRCRIAPANRTKFGLGRGFSDTLNRSSKPSKVRISGRAVERGKIYVAMYIVTMNGSPLFISNTYIIPHNLITFFSYFYPLYLTQKNTCDLQKPISYRIGIYIINTPIQK